jgi:5S rRNA maturation endonuclease (ribonuclease M5)
MDNIIEKVKEYLIQNDIPFKVNSSNTRIQLNCLNPSHVDSKPSMFVYNDGHFYCFGCNWHGKVSELFGIKYKNITISESLKPRNSNNIYNDFKIKNINPPEYLKLKNINFPIRGISEKTLKEFDVKITKAGDIYIPIKFNGKLVGYAIRYPHSWIYSKEKTINDKHFSQYLYPFHVNSKVIILVEGLFDMMKLWDNGFPALCTFGTHWTRAKTLSLIKICPQKIVLMFDNDQAGNRIQNILENELKDKFEIISLKIDRDPDEWIDIPRNMRKLKNIVGGAK